MRLPAQPLSVWCGAAVLIVTAAGAAETQQQNRGLICRGVEESGRLLIGQPGFGPHLVSLFVTGPNPLSASQTLPQHTAWADDPLHSYVADGTGALVIWAHPHGVRAAEILQLPALTGIEVQYAGDGTALDKLWDELLCACSDASRPFLWGFAADDTHSRTRIGLSWFCARLQEMDERCLKSALRGGAFYISNGPGIDDIRGEGKTISLSLPQVAEVLWLRAGQYLSAEPAHTVAVAADIGENHCLRCDSGVRVSTLNLDEFNLRPEEIRFVRAVVRTAPGSIAQTQPFRVRPDGTVDNPYPAAGEWVRGQTHNHTDSGYGSSNLPAFRLAYQEIGQLAGFSTDYSYWESPYQWEASDGTPHIASVAPARSIEGETVEVVVRGLNFGEAPTVQLGQRILQPAASGPEELRAVVSGDIAVGIHDLCVTNSTGFRDCLAQGFTVQSRDARNDNWRTFAVADGLVHARSTSAACFGDQVWIGAMTGVSRYQNGEWTTFGKEIPGWSAYAMAADPQGGIWVAGAGGLALCDPEGRWARHTVGQTDKLPAGRAAERWGRMAFDRTGDLWVTNRWGAGMGLLQDGRWRRLMRSDGLPSDSNSAVACDAAGVVWAGFGGLHRLTDAGWQRVELPAPLEACGYVSALAPAPDGSMWAAVTSGSRADRGGVVHLNGGGAKAYTPADCPLPSARIRDILVARNGDVWFASDTGVARLSVAGQWETITSVTSGLCCNIVLAMAQDETGRIWFATAEGVSCLEGQ